MKRHAAALLLLVVVFWMSGCAPVSVSKIDSGEHVIGQRMTITLPGPWNQVSLQGQGPARIWTLEGWPVDQFLVYSGVQGGEAIHATSETDDGKKVFRFRAAMEPDEIAALFEGMLTRDGSSYRLRKIEPASFGGHKGIRFEYDLTRRFDNVQVSGLAYAAVSRGELFALVYMAPRLGFFPRHAPMVEGIMRSARVRE